MKHTYEKDNLQGTFKASELKKVSNFTCEYKGDTIAFLRPVEKDGPGPPAAFGPKRAAFGTAFSGSRP